LTLTIVKPSKYATEELLTDVAGEVFSYLGEEFEVNVKFVCEKCIQGLNREFRGKNEPTNVLSFNASGGEKGGDIAICEPVVEKEARELNFEPQELCMLYLVHGMLHLAGFDHTSVPERDKMEKMEETILAKVGVQIER
jgi:probable rRNA maturation factor